LSLAGNHPACIHDPSSNKGTSTNSEEFEHDSSGSSNDGFIALSKCRGHATPEKCEKRHGSSNENSTKSSKKHEETISVVSEPEKLNERDGFL
jgi:hypothetical protein